MLPPWHSTSCLYSVYSELKGEPGQGVAERKEGNRSMFQFRSYEIPIKYSILLPRDPPPNIPIIEIEKD